LAAPGRIMRQPVRQAKPKYVLNRKCISLS
jgi:hypothetical protein